MKMNIGAVDFARRATNAFHPLFTTVNRRRESSLTNTALLGHLMDKGVVLRDGKINRDHFNFDNLRTLFQMGLRLPTVTEDSIKRQHAIDIYNPPENLEGDFAQGILDILLSQLKSDIQELQQPPQRPYFVNLASHP